MGEAVLTSENTVDVTESRYARIERERKFLLRDLPEPLTRASEHVQITDNYITNTRLRLRKVRVPKTNKWTLKLTQKYAGSDGDLSRTTVTNTYLSPKEYAVLAIFEGNEIRKNRYPFEFEGRMFGIDVFLGALWGLVIAETDFESDEEMDRYVMPPFAVEDISNDVFFSGGNLSQLNVDDIRAELERRAGLNGGK